jgi:hypothetical protein
MKVEDANKMNTLIGEVFDICFSSYMECGVGQCRNCPFENASKDVCQWFAMIKHKSSRQILPRTDICSCDFDEIMSRIHVALVSSGLDCYRGADGRLIMDILDEAVRGEEKEKEK